MTSRAEELANRNAMAVGGDLGFETAAELRRLAAEVETLREERTAWRVTAENAENDAARYRWLREGKSYEVRMKKAIVITGRNPERDYPEALDAAIDNAMKENPHG